MTKIEIQPNERKEIIAPNEFRANGEINGKSVGIFYIRGEGADYAVAKREQYLSDETYRQPDTTSLKIGLEKDKDDGLYVKNLSSTNTLEFYFNKADFILDSLNLGGQKANAKQIRQEFEEVINADGSQAQTVTIDLTENARTNVEAFMTHDSSVDVKIEFSNNPDAYWFTVDTATGVNQYHNGFSNAFRYARITMTAGSAGDEVTSGIMGAR